MQRRILATTLVELFGIFCFSSQSCYFWLNFFVVTSFNLYFVGKITRAFSLVRFESSKKVANFVFVKTSNGHNFCSGYQNHNNYICIMCRRKFPTPWQLAIGRLRSSSSKKVILSKVFYFSSFIHLFLSTNHFQLPQLEFEFLFEILCAILSSFYKVSHKISSHLDII